HDSLRPLVPEGRRKMRKAAKGLLRLEPELGVLATSPFLRAVQTADILAERFGKTPVEVKGLAADQEPKRLLPWLKRHGSAGKAVVAAVGHEPYLGRLVSLLLAGREGAFLELKKGGACLLEFTGPIAPGRSRLLWALTCAQLRRIGG
ncbi:MAG TPA: phosphohistidine phosphatase, partial [Elusimicrobia bacterium]|nr:phosphohistidine phosphatase [Elusimicrobiota bacterium]